MDRRSIIYITLLTLSFFGINYYFDSKRAAETAEKNELLVAQEQGLLSKAAAAKLTASIHSFPLVEITTSESGLSSPYAYDADGVYVVYGFSEKPPKTLSILQRNRSTQVNRIAYAKGKNSIALYSTLGEAELSCITAPSLGVTYLQALSLSPSPEITLARIEQGMISYPAGLPKADALLFGQQNGQYYPLAYYSFAENATTLLSDIDPIASNLMFETTTSESYARSEEFYVLENKYIQLVISTIGGSLSEINLPLRTKDDTDSVVLPIQFDRTIDKKYPSNALFPQKPYFIANEQGQLQKMAPKKGGYYPFLRRGITGAPPVQSMDSPIRYNALNLVSEDPLLSQLRYKVVKADASSVIVEALYRGKKIQKTYTLPSNPNELPYVFYCTIAVNGSKQGMWVTTGVPEVELISGNFMPALKYAKDKNGKIIVEEIKKPKPQTLVPDGEVDWLSNGNGFFGIILDPHSSVPYSAKAIEIPGEADPTRLSVIDAKYDLYPVKDYPGYELLLPLKDEPTPAKFRVFAGPYDTTILKTVDAACTDRVTGASPDYIATQTFHGWFAFISEPFAKFLLILMNFFHMITGSWGISIILLTVALRIMLYPLNNWSIKSMAKVQEVGPKIQRIREKYKNDPKKAQAELMKVYKEEGGNPFSGCLPLLIQMPFLIGMFDLLKSSFELRGASFIPGWINNLSAPDVLFSWGYPIPFIGNSFHLLPFILGGVMYLQQSFSQQKAKRKHVPLTEQQKQQQQAGKIMTIVFTFMFYKFPSGLNLYWISSMGLSVLQQWYTTRKTDKKS